MPEVLLSGRQSTSGNPYAIYELQLSTKARTPSSITFILGAYARLQYSQSWLGTGSVLTAGVYVGGSWHDWTLKTSSESWSGTAWHNKWLSADKAITVPITPGTTALTGIKFRVRRTDGGGSSCALDAVSCKNITVQSAVSEQGENISLAISDVDQTRGTATLTGFESCAYARNIKWYKDGSLVSTTTIAANSTLSSDTCTFTGLVPQSDYTIKAVIAYGDTEILSKSAVISTPDETGELTVTAKSTYITLSVDGMYDSPEYSRRVVFSYKKSTDSGYTTAATVAESGSSASHTITGLTSNVSYDVAVRILMGTQIVLKTMTQTATTPKDTSLVPVPGIVGISQKLGTRNITVEWLADKDIAGTTYKLISEDEDGNQAILAELSEITSPIETESPVGNQNVVFRISAENADVAKDVVNYSDDYSFYVRDDFVWDTPKTAGAAVVITAAEWNRLRDYAISRCADEDIVPDILLARQGERITAQHYNTMRWAVNQVEDVLVSEKAAGDQISAGDIDALRIAINTVRK